MDEFELLSPVFQDRLDQFSLSVSKRRIIENWKNKRPFCNTIEDKIRLFLSTKPLIEHSFREEYPEDQPDYDRLLDWITDCATASDILGDIEQRNIWIEIFAACEWVYYLSLLKNDFQGSRSSATS